MRLRSYILVAGGAAVVVGGIYLWRDAQGSRVAIPSEAAVAEAQARHARARGSAGRGDGERLRPAGRRRDGEVVEPDPSLAFPATAGPRSRRDLAADDRRLGPPPSEVDRVRIDGTMEPAIDPDNPEAASAMTESNKLYDRGDYDGARAMALKLLSQDPRNIRMIRVVVSSSCIMGDAELAEKYWSQLPTPDQAQMAIRCARYQVSFPAGGATTNTEK